MNELIKELVKQAGGHFSTHTLTSYPAQHRESIQLWDKNIEKFAELMVKKFDDILVLEQLDCVGNKDKQAAERIQRLQEKVKTYFGVEE